MKTFKFPGGVHPNDFKAMSSGKPIQNAPLMEKYILPLSQHIGAPATLLVKKGDKVKRGQKIAEAGGFVSAPLHAPTSGEIISIGKSSIGGEMTAVVDCIGPTGTLVPSVTLLADGLDEAGYELEPITNWEEIDREALVNRVHEAGIVGMGGAAFPARVKLTPPPQKHVDTLILNGAECEPYLTADHRLMLEEPQKVMEGALMLKRMLEVKEVYVGLEDNKLDAVEALEKYNKEGIHVVPLHVMYPQGSEKQLIYALTGRVVPNGGLPMDAQCVVQNVGTAAAVWEAIIEGKPLYERITTITGTPIKNPGNWRIRIGTPLGEALKLAGGVKDGNVGKILLGGPMMGLAQFSLDVPVLKNASGITLLTREEVVQYEADACIRCGRCVEACPMSLNPATLSVQIEKERFDLAEDWDVMACVECGACSYVCPSRRPLVQHFRRAKSHINYQRRKGQK